jgi:hypothetical protein
MESRLDTLTKCWKIRYLVFWRLENPAYFLQSHLLFWEKRTSLNKPIYQAHLVFNRKITKLHVVFI